MLQFRILGPLEVVERDSPLSLGGAKQRAVLAILLLHRGEAISSERLIEELWGERPPATAAKTLQGYVFHLRRALGDGLLHTRRPGYELELAPGQLDADEFERLAAEGRAALSDGDPAAAARCLRDALELWRGPPLADFAYESFAQAEIARLQEARVAALEDRIDADLELGRQEQLVGELDALVREFPLRERLRSQLMLALYRSGRQVESLAVYRDARETLVHELGLEPGRSLQELEQAILSHDPQLGASARRPPRPRAPRRAALLIGIGGLLLACAAAAAGIVALTAGGGGDHVKALGSGVAAIDSGTGRVVSLTETVTAPSNVAVGEGAVWVLNTEDRTISRIDPTTRKVVRRFEIGGVPSDIAAGAGALWVGNGGGPENNDTVSISRVDPHSNRITRTVRLPDTGSGSAWPTVGFPGIAVGAGAVWAINPDQTISRIDPKTGVRVATVARPGQYDRRGRRGRLVRRRGSLRCHADRSPHRPGRPDDPRRREHSPRNRRRRRVGLGDRRERGAGVAHRPGAASGDEKHRHRRRRELHHVRRRDGLGGQLRRRQGLADRPPHQHGHGKASRSEPHRRSRPATGRCG